MLLLFIRDNCTYGCRGGNQWVRSGRVGFGSDQVSLDQFDFFEKIDRVESNRVNLNVGFIRI
jgi:hypothetical protein